MVSAPPAGTWFPYMINALIKETVGPPTSGAGKPEPLKHDLAGYWSRRFTDEHPMVYRVDGVSLLIAQLRYYC